jgi:hypothetical protein
MNGGEVDSVRGGSSSARRRSDEGRARVMQSIFLTGIGESEGRLANE